MADHTHFPITQSGKGVPFERIRRITGYLAGDTSRWNDAKQAEERERVKHSTEVLQSVSEEKNPQAAGPV